MAAYYNEIDPFAAAWLRELIKAGLIADGDVDERSIEDVVPNELMGYKQCHFFAGIGVWSYSLRLARWPDNRPVWTGSCPCQPFSAAGKGTGFADERHLWPAWFHLISVCKPANIFGEQVASKDGLAWLDLVQADLEGEGYRCGAQDICAAGVGAPHIRQRQWIVADTKCGPSERYRYAMGGTQGGVQSETHERKRLWTDSGDGLSVGGVFHAAGYGWSRRTSETGFGSVGKPSWKTKQRFGAPNGVAQGDTDHTGLEGWMLPAQRARELFAGSPGVAGFWRDADWVYCRDQKYRPIEPGSFPLAHGVTNRVGRLRGYGNAISPWVAKEVIEAYMSLENGQEGYAG